MSVKHIVLASFFGLAVAFVAVTFSRVEPQSPFAKNSVFKPEQKRSAAWLPGKPNSPIRIHLYSPRGLALRGHEATQVQALVQLTQSIDQPLDFEWQLPEGVEVVQGDMRGTLNDLRRGQIYRVAVVVTGLGVKELPRNISLTVSTRINNQKIAATGVFASHDLQPDGSRRARREKSRDPASWFSKSSSDEDEEIPLVRPPRGLHF